MLTLDTNSFKITLNLPLISMFKTLLTLASVIIISLLGASYYAYFIYIPEKIENKIIASFNDFGFEKLEFGNVSRENGKIIFSDISLDEKKFSAIGKLSVHFSLIKFMFNPNHAQKIIIDDINLSGELSKGKLTFSGWDEEKEILESLRNIPADIIVIKSAAIDLLSDKIGGIKIDYNGQARLSKSGNIQIKGQATSKQKKLSFQAKINGDISVDGIISMNAQIDQISTIRENLSVKRGAASAKLHYSIKNSTYNISSDADFSSINWHNMPLRDISANIQANQDGLSLSAKGTVFGNEHIEWNTEISNNNNIVTAKTKIKPDNLKEILSFLSVNQRLQKNVNFPAFALALKQPTLLINTRINNNDGIIKGKFKLINNSPQFEIGGDFASSKHTGNIKGRFKSSKSEITTKDKKANFHQDTSGEFILRNINKAATMEWYVNTKISNSSLSYGALNIENINGKFLYSSNSPKKSKTYLRFKLPLKPYIKQSGGFNINVTDKNSPLFKSAMLKIYDGTIKTQTPLFKDDMLSKSNKLIISDIDLTQFFYDAKFNNVTIFGQLGGVMPLTVEDNKININGTILQSQGSGIIKLPRSLIDGLFNGDSLKMQLIRKALKNYHYEFFEIRIDGDLLDKIMITLNASGYNPNVNNAKPIDINLHIETQASVLFGELMQQ